MLEGEVPLLVLCQNFWMFSKDAHGMSDPLHFIEVLLYFLGLVNKVRVVRDTFLDSIKLVNCFF
jgi:hypothetical protein